MKKILLSLSILFLFNIGYCQQQYLGKTKEEIEKLVVTYYENSFEIRYNIDSNGFNICYFNLNNYCIKTGIILYNNEYNKNKLNNIKTNISEDYQEFGRGYINFNTGISLEISEVIQNQDTITQLFYRKKTM